MNTEITPLFSIAMAVYNGEKYLRQQIDSLLAQTVSDFEIVICDDCSTDGTWNLIKFYSECDDRIRAYQNSRNLGFKKNFEHAISLCTGEYIALSDQDDIWTQNHLELLYNSIGDKYLACGNSELVNEGGGSLGITLKEQEALDYIPENDFDKLKSILLFRNPYQGASMLFKKELIQYVLPFPDAVNFHDTWIASIACITGGLTYVDKVILKYRRVSNSVTGNRSKRKSKLVPFLHAWLFEDRIDLINELLLRVKFMSPKIKKTLISYRVLIENNTMIRKPITIFHLLLDYKNIYSCDRNHWI